MLSTDSGFWLPSPQLFSLYLSLTITGSTVKSVRLFFKKKEKKLYESCAHCMRPQLPSSQGSSSLEGSASARSSSVPSVLGMVLCADTYSTWRALLSAETDGGIPVCPRGFFVQLSPMNTGALLCRIPGPLEGNRTTPVFCYSPANFMGPIKV